MKNLAALLLLLCTQAAFAGNSPFSDALEKALNINGGSLGASSEALGLQTTVRVAYNVAVEGGTSSTTIKALGVTLPPKSVVMGFTAYTETAFINSGTARGTLLCGSTVIDSQRNLDTAAQGGMFAVTTSVDCGNSSAAIGLRLTDATPTAGKVTYYIQYFIHD